MKRIFAIHNNPTVQLLNGKFVKGVDPREVRVMAIAENFAMVRRKGAMPYVAPVRELVFNEVEKRQNRKADQ